MFPACSVEWRSTRRDEVELASSATVTPPTEKKSYTDAEKKACSIEAMRNGGTCESCQ